MGRRRVHHTPVGADDDSLWFDISTSTPTPTPTPSSSDRETGPREAGLACQDRGEVPATAASAPRARRWSGAGPSTPPPPTPGFDALHAVWADVAALSARIEANNAKLLARYRAD